MVNIDVELPKHINVKHNIENDEQFVLELSNAIDLIVSDRIKSRKDLSAEQNIKRAVQYRNQILQNIANQEFCCPECYIEDDLIQYE